MPEWRYSSFLLLVAAVFAVFYQVCSHDFLAMDDEYNIYLNSQVINFNITNLVNFWKEPYGAMYIPVTYDMWSIQAKISSLYSTVNETGFYPIIFHTSNLLLHLANSFIVLLILRILLKNQRAALAGALVFALHPVQAEPVAWVTGFKDVLSGFWSLMAIWQYILYTRTASPGRSLIPYALATISFLLAILSKPGAVTLPLVVCAIAYLPLNRNVRQLAKELIPWVIAVIPVILVTKLYQPDIELPFIPDFWQRFLVAGDALSFYIYKITLPLSLCPDYGRSPQLVLDHSWMMYLTGLAPYLIIFLLVWKKPEPGLTIAWIIIGALLPVLGFIPFSFQEISTVADRYLYVAILGAAYGVGWLLDRYNTRAAWIIFVAIMTLMGLKTSSQASYWRDHLTIYRHTVDVNPQSWIYIHNQGVEEHKRHHPSIAIKLYAESLKINPNYVTARENLEKAVQYVAMTIPEAAFSGDSENIDTDIADHAGGYYKLGRLCQEVNAQKEALILYQKALEANHAYARAYLGIGEIFTQIDMKEKAVEAYRKALETDPTLVEAQKNLALLGTESGHD